MTTNQHTRYIEINKGYATIRLDEIGADTLVTVYNVNIKDIDLLIEKLQAVKAEHNQSDEPPQMTAVLGPKPDPTGWYKNALQKASVQPAPKSQPPAIVIPMPPMPQPKRGDEIINIIGVTTKDRVSHGKKYPGTKQAYENADICKGEWIRIYGISDNRVRWDKETKKQITYREAYDRTFKMGDTVEYDSYNLSHTGQITAIGEKTVTIESYGKSHRLDLHEFIWRNWDLDLQKIADENLDWSMHS